MKTAGVVFNIQKYSVHDGPGIRTVVFLKGRREVERVVGFRGELYLDEIVQTELLGG